jgi:HSP20 family protein
MIDDRVLEPLEEMMPMTDLSRRAVYPKVDIEEDNQNVTVKANIPGVDPDNVDLNVEEDILTMSGVSEREEDKTDEEK